MQSRWWRAFLIIIFFLGLVLCASELETTNVRTASAQPRALGEMEEGSLLRAFLHDARNVFDDLGTLTQRAATGLAEKSRPVLGYLMCVIFLVLPLGVWALLNLGQIVGLSNWQINVSSTKQS